jgi:hypothetical protein
MGQQFTDPMPPGPLESTNTRDWLYRLGKAVAGIGTSESSSFISIVNPPTISFSDDVPLVMSDTTQAQLVYRSATKSLTLANGLVDLLAINVVTKLATFAAGGVFGGNLTINTGGLNVLAGGATITGGLTVTSGGAAITGAITGSSSITAKNDIVSQQGNLTVKDTQGIIFNNNSGNSSFIRHNASGMEFWGSTGMIMKLLDSQGLQIAAATFQAATAGGASPLPATPDRYLSFGLIGSGAGAPGLYRIPLYL